MTNTTKAPHGGRRHGLNASGPAKVIKVTLDLAASAELDVLAVAWGLTRSAVIRRLLARSVTS